MPNFARTRQGKIQFIKHQFSTFASALIFIPTEREIILDGKRDL